MAVLTIDILSVSRELSLSIEELSESGLVTVVDLCVSGLSASSSQYLDGSVEGGESESETEDVSLLVSLLGSYSEFVTSDMLEAQDAVSSVTLSLSSLLFLQFIFLFVESLNSRE
jgi:hypothetical protein